MISHRFSRGHLSQAGVAVLLIALAGCSQKSELTVQPSQASPTALRAAPSGPDPLAAAKDAANPAPAKAASQATQDTEDNARSTSLAPQLVAHPQWLARQDALCGPNNMTLQARVAASPRPLPSDVRDLKVACIAKDIAHRDIAAGAGAAGGVQNTHSL